MNNTVLPLLFAIVMLFIVSLSILFTYPSTVSKKTYPAIVLDKRDMKDMIEYKLIAPRHHKSKDKKYTFYTSMKKEYNINDTIYLNYSNIYINQKPQEQWK